MNAADRFGVRPSVPLQLRLGQHRLTVASAIRHGVGNIRSTFSADSQIFHGRSGTRGKCLVNAAIRPSAAKARRRPGRRPAGMVVDIPDNRRHPEMYGTRRQTVAVWTEVGSRGLLQRLPAVILHH